MLHLLQLLCRAANQLLRPENASGSAAGSTAAAPVADAAASEPTAAASQLQSAGEDGAAAQTAASMQPQGMDAASAVFRADPAAHPAAPLAAESVEAWQPQGHAPQQRQPPPAERRRYSRSALFQLLEAGGACSLPDFAAAREVTCLGVALLAYVRVGHIPVSGLRSQKHADVRILLWLGTGSCNLMSIK